MKKIILIMMLLIKSLLTFSQSGTVNQYKNQIVEDLRTKDILAEKVVLQKKLIDTLTVQNGEYRKQSSQNAQYYQSCMTENAALRNQNVNLKGLWKMERGKKRKRGVVIGTIIVAAFAKGTYDLYRKFK